MSRLTSEPFRRKSDDSLENYKVRRKGREEWETLAQNAINKLGRLEDIEEELGCPLEVVFKAIEDGVYIEVEHLPDVIERPRLYYSDDNKCYCLEMLYGEYVVKLSDYQKNWWLKGEKDETCDGTN